MRSTRSLALVLVLIFTLAGAGTAAFALTDDGTGAATKAGRTSKQVPTSFDRYKAEQARAQAEVDAYLKALDERNRFLAGVAAAEQERAEAARQAQERASRAAAARTATAAATVSRAPAYGPWADLINQYPWPAQTAYDVMMCESSGNANAYNASSGATGLFQILNGPFDPHENVALAFRMWQQRGWQPWRACI